MRKVLMSKLAYPCLAKASLTCNYHHCHMSRRTSSAGHRPARRPPIVNALRSPPTRDLNRITQF